jgi:hypothetical protein
MSGHHPFHELAAKVTCTSEARAAVDACRRHMEFVVSVSRPPTAAHRTRADRPSRPQTPNPAEE